METLASASMPETSPMSRALTPVRSDLRSPTVHEQFYAVHKAAVVRCQEYCRLGNLAGFTETAHRDECGEMGEQAVLMLRRHEPAKPRRANRAGTDSVHTD